MAGVNEKIEPLSKKRRDLEKKLLDFKKNVDTAKSNYEIAKSKLELYTSEEQKEKNKLQAIQESVKAAAEKLDDRKKQLALFQQKIPATEKSLNEAQRELQLLKEQENQATVRLRIARVKFDEQKSMMQSNRSRNRILDALMKEKREGRIVGIMGRLVSSTNSIININAKTNKQFFQFREILVQSMLNLI